ncbi:MAG: dTDP-4-amino-4,6-dideoxy-D-glucose transaminase [Myxococcaceae bacterium]
MSASIPFNKPVHLGTELDAIAQAIHVSAHTAGGGPFGKKCEERLEGLLKTRTLLVTSCTHALEMAGMLLGLKPGDEFIVPSFTFVSTANAFLLRGAKPVFVDCDLDGNIDLADVQRSVTPRTKAIVAVHYAGSSCDMQRLLELAGQIPVVEDAAQSITATFDGKPLGTFGAMGALSFHETKNIGSGEGGALIVNDPRFVERAEYIRDKGTNRRRFLNGLVDKYTWVDEGSSYVLSDLNAAYLWTQLVALEQIQARRKAIYERYQAELGPLAAQQGMHVVSPSSRVKGNQHLFALVMRSLEQRTRFIAHMKDRGVMTPFHYVALHKSPMGAKLHHGRALPMTERLSDGLVRFPLFYNLTDADLDRVIAAAKEFLHGPA